jgi:hypothetical protein
VKSISLSKERRIRLWLNGVNFENRSGFRDIVDASGWTAHGSRIYFESLKVEAFIPLGARFLHGILGCKLVPYRDGKQHRVEFEFRKKKHQICEKSLVNGLDVIFFGLSDEFLACVKDAVNCTLAHDDQDKKFNIVVDEAAHGEIGSSISIFKALSSFLASSLIMLNTCESVDEEKFAILIEKFESAIRFPI